MDISKVALISLINVTQPSNYEINLIRGNRLQFNAKYASVKVNLCDRVVFKLLINKRHDVVK